jgi:hypothetical protein
MQDASRRGQIQGSGRTGGFSSWPKCESYHSIDLAWLRRKGLPGTGLSSTLRWSRHGQETGSISLTVQEQGLQLRYQIRDDRGEPLAVSELISFSYTGAEFGGRRQWLKCLSCGRRCRVIYGGRYFRCHLCQGLRYQSQSEPDYDRALEQANRIRARLGDTTFSAFEVDELPPKSPRMRWKTYRKLQVRYAALQRRWKAEAAARFLVQFHGWLKLRTTPEHAPT